MTMKAKIIFTVLALMAFTTMAVAQDKSPEQQSETQAANRTFVDANNNGINYYAEQGGRFFMNRRGMGNGPAMGYGPGMGYRRGMAPGQGRGIARGQGRGFGPGQGRGLAPGGRYFVDENKNGVCDLYEDVQENK